MTDEQIKYIDYLKRFTRTSNKSISEAHKEKIVQEVGISYGLSLSEMDEAVNIEEINC